MNSLWNDFIQSFGSACARMRESIMQARTTQDVAAALSGLEAQASSPVATQDEQLLHGLCGAMVEAIHRQAIADLHNAPQAQFERLLQWHIAHNLEPCRRLFPQLHADFEMKLQRTACARWLLEVRQDSQDMH
jgi:hypothetical protein